MKDLSNLGRKIHLFSPFEPIIHDTIIFSIGNPCEAHGPALPTDTDSRCANFIAYKICKRTKARFISHIPYTTDRVGKISLDWSPLYLPMEEFVIKCLDFIKFHCKILRTQPNMKFSKIVIINSHGGNAGMAEYSYWKELQDEFNTKLIFVDTFDIDVTKNLKANRYLSSESKNVYLSIAPGHADTMEHSIASLYGAVDNGKLYQLNRFIQQKGTDATLKKWPVLAGLGGYIKFGGDEYEPLRRIEALVACLKQFEKDKQIILFPEFAKMVIESLITKICTKIV